MKFRNEFYILRHGQTIYQTTKKDLVYPREESFLSIGLTEEGSYAVRKTAIKAREISFDFIFSSDFLRAKETAMIVANEISLKEDRVFLSSELRDIFLGSYHGGPKEDFHKDLPNFLIDFDTKPKGGESLNEAKERIVNFLNKIEEKYNKKKILIVSHGELLWLLEGAIKGRSENDFLDKDFFKKNYISTAEMRKLT